jgi:hypothetical protein
VTQSGHRGDMYFVPSFRTILFGKYSLPSVKDLILTNCGCRLCGGVRGEILGELGTDCDGIKSGTVYPVRCHAS